ncbi:MAG: hypothetical protein LIP08_03020 [Bacteroides sp.]|nr:hypothetical protein [Bacteroides sp.]
MAAVVIKPDALNLSGNMNNFVLTGSSLVSFVLKKGSAILLNQTYEPGPDRKITIDVKDIVEHELTFTLDGSNGAYTQAAICADFTAEIDGVSYPFRVIRGGVANLADTAANWLKLHFLTWQPKMKEVTYYSPEWLTYYAVQDCSIVLKATFEDYSTYSTAIAGCAAGKATTCNMQYAYISGLLNKRYPIMYEVWAESGTTKLTESQYYLFSDVQSEDEQWFLFENSLGGIDTFRAYGVKSLQAEHEHNIAMIGDEQLEYQVDTERKYVKNTGFLDDYSRRWLLDFFPSQEKYIYEAGAIRKIIVTESEVNYDSNDLPSNYSFTYQFAKRQPYLNLIRNESEIPANLTIPTPEKPDFILPPRLAELPRQELSEGVLIPAMDPHWPLATVTTYGAIHKNIYENVMGDVAAILADFFLSIGDGGSGSGGGGGGDGFYHIRSIDTTEPTDENAFTALRTLIEIEKNNDYLDNRYIRKDIDDYAQGNINFRRNIFVQYEATLTNAYILNAIYTHDLADNYNNPGFHIDAESGIAWLEKLRVKKGSIFAGELSSPTFVSGFPNGYG